MQEKESVKSLLENSDKRIGYARNTLAMVWREILAKQNMSLSGWDMSMERYLRNPRNGIMQDSKSKSSARGNLNKELTRDVMSWRVFEKGLRFLGPVQVRMKIELEWQNKTMEEFVVTIDTNSPMIENGDDEEIIEEPISNLVHLTIPECADKIEEVAPNNASGKIYYGSFGKQNGLKVMRF